MTGTDPAVRAGLWDGPAEQLPRALTRHRKYGVSKLRFPQAQTFFKNYRNLSTRLQEGSRVMS